MMGCLSPAHPSERTEHEIDLGDSTQGPRHVCVALRSLVSRIGWHRVSYLGVALDQSPSPSLQAAEAAAAGRRVHPPGGRRAHRASAAPAAALNRGSPADSSRPCPLPTPSHAGIPLSQRAPRQVVHVGACHHPVGVEMRGSPW